MKGGWDSGWVGDGDGEACHGSKVMEGGIGGTRNDVGSGGVVGSCERRNNTIDRREGRDGTLEIGGSGTLAIVEGGRTRGLEVAKEVARETV